MANTTEVRVSDSVRAAAAQFGYTQLELAGLLGISRQALGHRLNGHTKWALDEVVVLARVLELDVHELLADEEVPA